MSDIPEITYDQFKRAIPARIRARLILGQVFSGEDVVVLRRFIGMSRKEFARAKEISVHTLRNREQGLRIPRGPATGSNKNRACPPRIIRENLDSAA